MITTEQFRTLDDLYRYYNIQLFNSILPECIINMSRKNSTYGFFAPCRWKDLKENDIVHEISLNPDFMMRPFREWHSTLVHEMCHLWQFEFGNPSRRAYHNHEWADKMEEIGLMPSNTGSPDGKRVGQQMTHYVIEGGAFDRVFSLLDIEELENLRLKYLPAMVAFLNPTKGIKGVNGKDDPEPGKGKDIDKKTKSGQRIKYMCSCGQKVWGKSGLNIRCNLCDSDFTET